MEKEKPKFKFPTEVVELPSKGLLYPEGHPLSSGTVEIKYMTAKEEDILTNLNYIKQGIVIDKLLQSLIVTPFDYDDLLVGDKNSLMISARVLGYGKEYLPVGVNFFSLTSEQASNYRSNLFTQIHEIVFHGKGGYDWYTVYNMPNAIRLFTFSRLKKYYEEKEEAKNGSTSSNVDKSIANMKAAGAVAKK
jgi:hypothetical protein